MKVLVTGGRTFGDRPSVDSVLGALHADAPIRAIIEGGAKGADSLAREWAERNQVPCLTVHANWAAEGKKAGPIRNARMLRESPDLVVAFAGGRGTENMKQQAREAGVQVLDVTRPTCLGCDERVAVAGRLCHTCQLDYDADRADAEGSLPPRPTGGEE